MPSYVANLNELTAPVAGDFVLVSDTSDSVDKDKKMQLAKLAIKNGTPTGGRLVSWTDANQVQDAGFIVADFPRKQITPAPVANRGAMWADANTLTDTGFAVSDVARLSVGQTYTGANTFSALQTFASGIKMAAANLTVFDQGPMTPGITGSTGAPTVTYSVQDGFYQRFNNIVYFYFFFQISTISGGSGLMRTTGLPFVASLAQQPRCNFFVDQVVLAGASPYMQSMFAVNSQTYTNHVVYQNNVAYAQYNLSAFGAGDSVACSGSYVAVP